MYILMIAGIVALVFWAVSELSGYWKDKPEDDAEGLADGDDDAVVTRPLGDADALAQQGKFREAIHIYACRAARRYMAAPVALDQLRNNKGEPPPFWDQVTSALGSRADYAATLVGSVKPHIARWWTDCLEQITERLECGGVEAEAALHELQIRLQFADDDDQLDRVARHVCSAAPSRDYYAELAKIIDAELRARSVHDEPGSALLAIVSASVRALSSSYAGLVSKELGPVEAHAKELAQRVRQASLAAAHAWRQRADRMVSSDGYLAAHIIEKAAFASKVVFKCDPGVGGKTVLLDFSEMKAVAALACRAPALQDVTINGAGDERLHMDLRFSDALSAEALRQRFAPIVGLLDLEKVAATTLTLVMRTLSDTRDDSRHANPAVDAAVLNELTELLTDAGRSVRD